MQGIQARLSSTEDLDASRGLKSVLNVIIYNMWSIECLIMEGRACKVAGNHLALSEIRFVIQSDSSRPCEIEFVIEIDFTWPCEIGFVIELEASGPVEIGLVISFSIDPGLLLCLLGGQGGLTQTHLGSHGVVKKTEVPVGSVRESWEGLQGPAG
jgi:hypothetical protein